MSECVGCGAPLPPNRAPGRARKWCSEKCRKATLYSGACIDCGGATNGSNGRDKAGKRCSRCWVAYQCRPNAPKHGWTDDAVTARILEWTALYGEPPAQSDWHTHSLRRLGDEERIRRYVEAEGRWPCYETVKRRFGSWNNAIRAAGLPTRPPGGGSGNELRMRSMQREV